MGYQYHVQAPKESDEETESLHIGVKFKLHQNGRQFLKPH